MEMAVELAEVLVKGRLEVTSEEVVVATNFFLLALALLLVE